MKSFTSALENFTHRQIFVGHEPKGHKIARKSKVNERKVPQDLLNQLNVLQQLLNFTRQSENLNYF